MKKNREQTRTPYRPTHKVNQCRTSHQQKTKRAYKPCAPNCCSRSCVWSATFTLKVKKHRFDKALLSCGPLFDHIFNMKFFWHIVYSICVSIFDDINNMPGRCKRIFCNFVFEKPTFSLFILPLVLPFYENDNVFNSIKSCTSLFASRVFISMIVVLNFEAIVTRCTKYVIAFMLVPSFIPLNLI